MKELITAAASLMILMVFVLQFAADQSFAVKSAAAEAICRRVAGETAAGDEDKMAKELRKEISGLWGCNISEVDVAIDEIGYEVSLPVKNVIACGAFLGIPEEQNMTEYRTSGELRQERGAGTE